MAQPKLTLSGTSSPDRLGRYLLGRELGRGFSSVVYEATDPLRGRRVALKVLTFLQNLSPGRRQDLAERFGREARAISTLAHPAIVAIYEVGQAEDGRQFLVMEYLEGETLRARLERAGPLPEAEALPLIAQIADALQYAHGRGIVHRDVKPDNVFVCPGGAAKLMDFGVAHVFAAEGLTQTGTVVGSPAYMSPEQINGRRLDGRSDVFSLAVTLAEAVTGRKPFDAPNIPAVMNNILHRPPQLAGVPSRPLRKVLERALAKNPQARLPSPAAFAEALRRVGPALTPAGWRGSPQATTVMPRLLPAFTRPRRVLSRNLLGLGAIALGLAALAALPFVLPRRPNLPAPVGKVSHISSAWRRAGSTRRARPRHRAVAAAPLDSLDEGEGRITEMFPARKAAALPMLTASRVSATPTPPDILRLLRQQPDTRRDTPPWQSAPPVRPRLSLPADAAPPRPVVRTADSRQEHPAPISEPVARFPSVPPAPPIQNTPPAPVENARPISAPIPDPVSNSDSRAAREPYAYDLTPRLFHRTAPVYPPEARGRGEQGRVRLLVSVNEDGDVMDARVTRSSGYPDLDAAAIATVMQWEYEPAFHEGRAVPGDARAQVTF